MRSVEPSASFEQRIRTSRDKIYSGKSRACLLFPSQSAAYRHRRSIPQVYPTPRTRIRKRPRHHRHFGHSRRKPNYYTEMSSNFRRPPGWLIFLFSTQSEQKPKVGRSGCPRSRPQRTMCGSVRWRQNALADEFKACSTGPVL